MSKNPKQDLKNLVKRAEGIRARYHALERKHHGTEWSVTEDALAFLTDAALVARLTMAHQGRWPRSGSTGELEHKLGECVWWLAVIADRTGVDLEEALEAFLSTTEKAHGAP